MLKDQLILHSTIHPNLMHRTLMKGFILAFLGASLLVWSGIYLDPQSLSLWGGFIYIASFALIGWGLISYRRLSRLASKPDTLIVHGNDVLEYSTKGKIRTVIPLSSIEKMTYREGEDEYGIVVWIKPEAKNQIQGKKNRDGLSVFFPYFSKRSYQELLEAF